MVPRTEEFQNHGLANEDIKRNSDCVPEKHYEVFWCVKNVLKIVFQQFLLCVGWLCISLFKNVQKYAKRPCKWYFLLMNFSTHLAILRRIYSRLDQSFTDDDGHTKKMTETRNFLRLSRALIWLYKHEDYLRMEALWVCLRCKYINVNSLQNQISIFHKQTKTMYVKF